MIEASRRRVLGLLAAALGAPALRARPAFAAEDCYASQDFGPWKALATNNQAGARMNEVPFVDPGKSDLTVQVQISDAFDAKLVVYGDPDARPLPKNFLLNADNRIIAKNEDGSIAVDEPLCGVCTDIHDDKVSIVLPLATAPLFRDAKSALLAIKLGTAEECSFKLDCETLRKALAWATDKRSELQTQFSEGKCNPPEGCFVTSACCELLGLPDDCFELRALRRFRDDVLAAQAGGHADIAVYYRAAPVVLRRIPEIRRRRQLLLLYVAYILPSAIAARLGFNGFAYRRYGAMMRRLVDAFAPDLRAVLGSSIF